MTCRTRLVITATLTLLLQFAQPIWAQAPATGRPAKHNADFNLAKGHVRSPADRQERTLEAAPNTSGDARPLITANVIHRVFRIKYGQNVGTGFAIDVDGRQYFVTAKHIVAPLVDKGQIEIFANGTWNTLPIQLVGHATDADVSVLTTDRRLTPSDLPLEPTSKGMAYSQEVFFLDFPYNILSQFIFEGSGYPLPLVKKAIVSSFVKVGLYLLDGHNNPGFSGSPVVFARDAGNRGRVLIY